MGIENGHTLGDLAAVVGGTVEGDSSLVITDIASLQDAQQGHITFVAHPKYLPHLKTAQASAVILDRIMPADRPALRVEHPYRAFATLLTFFRPRPRLKPGIMHPVMLGERVRVGREVTLFPFVTLGDDVQIGDRVVLHPGVFVGAGSSIGDDSILYANVTLYDHVTVGQRTIIHAGAVLGSDGYGFIQGEDGRHVKIPQVGEVLVEDDVEIGANVCIDRATLGKTIIRRGTKIDNLVHIAHNVEVGEDNLLLAQVGISGSCRLGSHVTLAGQVGLIDHLTIGDRATIVAQSGVARDVEPHTVMAGSLAMPHGTWRRVQVAIPKIPALLHTVTTLERRLAALEARLSQSLQASDHE